jgi:hypothetical protein
MKDTLGYDTLLSICVNPTVSPDGPIIEYFGGNPAGFGVYRFSFPASKIMGIIEQLDGSLLRNS